MTSVPVALAWSPLRHFTFRWLWIASIALNIDTLMHEVGAGWYVQAMRRRSGALKWGLVQNTENPDSWLEFFIDGSWLEHMRHHGRVTKADRQIEPAARRFQQPDVEPVVNYHLMHVARR